MSDTITNPDDIVDAVNDDSEIKRIMRVATPVTPIDCRYGNEYAITMCKCKNNIDEQRKCANFISDYFGVQCAFDNRYMKMCDVNSYKYDRVINFKENKK